MASSQSTGMAQTPTVCQFCEDSPDIKWKCVNCELFLCQLCCSKIHSKSKASMAHEILNTKDFGMEDLATSMRKVELENMMCTVHAKQKCFVFCKECSQPACSQCLIETHKLHDYKDIDEEYNKTIFEMKELLTKFESNVQFLKNEKDKLKKILSDGDKNFQETRDMIRQTEDNMKTDISRQANKLFKKLQAIWTSSENMIKTELSVIIKQEKELETKRTNLIQALKSHQVEHIFSTSRTLDKSLPKYLVKEINLNRTQFIPRKIKVSSKSKSALGDLLTEPDIE